MSSDKLTEIPTSDWPALRDLYLVNWPTNFLGYQTVDNYIQWVKQRPTIKNLNIYSLNDDWLDGTFVVMVLFGFDQLKSYVELKGKLIYRIMN